MVSGSDTATAITAIILLLIYQAVKDMLLKTLLKKIDSLIRKDKNHKLELEKIISSLSHDLEKERQKNKKKLVTSKVDFNLNGTRELELDEGLFCVINSEGYFTNINTSWENFLGYEAMDLYRYPLLCFIHDEDKKMVEAELNQLRSHYKKTTSFQCRFIAKDGSYHPLEWSTTILTDKYLIYAIVKEIEPSSAIFSRKPSTKISRV